MKNVPGPKAVTNEEFARLERRYDEWMAKLLNPEPVHVVMVPVSAGMAQRIEANPSGVRVVHRDEFGTAMEGPRRNPNHVTVKVDLVTAVDKDGRPFYWDRGSVVHEYDPLSRL
jgi:hypothetical protein